MQGNSLLRLPMYRHPAVIVKYRIAIHWAVDQIAHAFSAQMSLQPLSLLAAYICSNDPLFAFKFIPKTRLV